MLSYNNRRNGPWQLFPTELSNPYGWKEAAPYWKAGAKDSWKGWLLHFRCTTVTLKVHRCDSILGGTQLLAFVTRSPSADALKRWNAQRLQPKTQLKINNCHVHQVKTDPWTHTGCNQILISDSRNTNRYVCEKCYFNHSTNKIPLSNFLRCIVRKVQCLHHHNM